MPVLCSPVQGYPIAVKQMHAPANAVRGLGGCGPEVSVWVCALLRPRYLEILGKTELLPSA